MTEPIGIDSILSEFTEDDSAWIVMDAISGARLNVPAPQYPGIDVVRFFLSPEDAARHIEEVLKAAPHLRESVLVPVPVPLIKTATGIAAQKKLGAKVGFVVHSPNEVFENYGA